MGCTFYGGSEHYSPTISPARGNGAVSSADDIPTCEPTDAGLSAAKSDGDC